MDRKLVVFSSLIKNFIQLHSLREMKFTSTLLPLLLLIQGFPEFVQAKQSRPLCSETSVPTTTPTESPTVATPSPTSEDDLYYSDSEDKKRQRNKKKNKKKKQRRRRRRKKCIESTSSAKSATGNSYQLSYESSSESNNQYQATSGSDQNGGAPRTSSDSNYALFSLLGLFAGLLALIALVATVLPRRNMGSSKNLSAKLESQENYVGDKMEEGIEVV